MSKVVPAAGCIVNGVIFAVLALVQFVYHPALERVLWGMLFCLFSACYIWAALRLLMLSPKQLRQRLPSF